MSIKSILCSFFDREFIAELLSTFMLILLGDGCVAQYKLLNHENPGSEPFLTINCGYGCGVVFGAYLAGGVSGAHMNPAVSIGLALVRKFQWKKVPKYIVAQMLGAFLGATLVFLVYLDRLRDNKDLILEDNFRGIFATYPHPGTTIAGRLLDQIVGTMILLMVVMALSDKNNTPPPQGVAPLVVGLTVFAIGASFGTNCGYAINPARDLSPRIASAIFGYDGTFSAYDVYFWIPVVGPIVGGLIGAAAYAFMIERPGECALAEQRNELEVCETEVKVNIAATKETEE